VAHQALQSEPPAGRFAGQEFRGGRALICILEMLISYIVQVRALPDRGRRGSVRMWSLAARLLLQKQVSKEEYYSCQVGLGSTTPGCSQAHNRGHSRECPAARRNFVGGDVVAQYDFEAKAYWHN